MNGHWQKPEMNVEGQTIFWDDKAPIYDIADMTVDNQPEVDVVIERCREISCEEIITLGGAVGCRDPKMILEDILTRNALEPFPSVTFNDLSPKMVDIARDKVLRRFIEMDFTICFVPGEIRKVCANIGKGKPRRLLIGVYNSRSFFVADPASGYPMCGFDEYSKNREILGVDLLFDWMRFESDHGLFESGMRSLVCGSDEEKRRLTVKQDLHTFFESIGSSTEIIGLQIVGRTSGRNGFFISHWYRPTVFSRMLASVFPPSSFTITQYQFAKGMVCSIDPIDRTPCGVITVLNNVIGNVLPHHQLETLVAIRDIMV